MPLAIGDYVQLRPSLFDLPRGVASSLAGQVPIWQIDERHYDADLETFIGYRVRYVWPVGYRVRYAWPVALFAPTIRYAGLDDVIRCDPPKAPPLVQRDPLTGLTLDEAERLYRTRLDQACRGEPLAPPVGWDATRAILHTPYGPIALSAIAAWDGVVFEAIPDQIQPHLRWAADFYCRLR